MANLAAASRSILFEREFNVLPEEIRRKLTEIGFSACATWANFSDFEVPLDNFEHFDELRTTTAKNLLSEIGFSEQDENVVRQILKIYDTAAREGDSVARRQGSITDMAISADVISLQARRHDEVEKADLAKVALLSLAHLPQEWRGKRYRRTAGQPTENAREEGERQERLKKVKEVAGLLVEAKFPFALTLGPGALEGDTSLRCCRGLRAKALAQEVACWRPF